MSLNQLLLLLCLVVVLSILAAPRAGSWFIAWLWRPKPANPLTIPTTDSINKIEIRQGLDKKRAIADQSVIKQFLVFLSQTNNNWKTVPTTFPTGKYAIALRYDDSRLLTLWLGNRWIAVQHGGQRTRSLSEAEASKLKAILGIEGFSQC